MTRSWCGQNMRGCNVVDNTVSSGTQTPSNGGRIARHGQYDLGGMMFEENLLSHSGSSLSRLLRNRRSGSCWVRLRARS